MMWAALLAGSAGAFAAAPLAGFAELLLGAASSRSAPLARRARTWVEAMLQPLRLAGAQGLIATDRERIRLQASAAAIGLAAGLVVSGLPGGVVLAGVSSSLASRSLVWRRARYRRRLEAGASSAALAIADALAAGHSVRGAIVACAGGLNGPIANELRAVTYELEFGAETDAALVRLRRRARSRRVDLIVAAVRIQRRSGGSLAGLLRSIAKTIEEHEQLGADARAASAQARFTSLIVLLLPGLGLLLGELSSPGLIGRMVGSPIGIWLFGSALGLQLGGLLLIRRLSRVQA